jgi:histidinol phosphatase-like PHP family hydrolase
VGVRLLILESKIFACAGPVICLARYKLPSKTFIQRAKKAGVKFAFGTNNGGKELGHLEYSRRMAKQCDLTEKNMFTPEHKN